MALSKPAQPFDAVETAQVVVHQHGIQVGMAVRGCQPLFKRSSVQHRHAWFGNAQSMRKTHAIERVVIDEQ